jgi:hypothetical protein
MKKISVLFVCALVLSTFLSSCSSDDDSPSTSSFEIEGKWNYNKLSYNQNGITTPEVDHPENEVGCSKDYVEFKAGGILTLGDYTTGCAFTQHSGTWTKTGNNMTASAPSLGMSDTFEIVSVTATELKLRVTHTVSGITITVNESFTKG